MSTFNSIDELKQFLLLDANRRTTSPIRFINVDSLSDWLDMKDFLNELATKSLFLSDYCADDDTVPNMWRLRDDLRKANQDVFVLSMSAFFHVNRTLAEKEATLLLNYFPNDIYSFRVYMLMYRMKEFFMSLQYSDPRQAQSILILPAEQTDNYSLTIIQKSKGIEALSESVDGFKQYMKYREQSPATPLTVYTENAEYLQDQRFFKDVTLIANAFDLLRYRYNLPYKFERIFGSDEYWQQLAVYIEAKGSFEEVFCREFVLDTFSLIAFKDFNKLGNFQKWLLWLRCKLQEDDYVALCADASNSPEEFVVQIYELIFSYADDRSFDELCSERRDILSLMHVLPSESFFEKVRQSKKRVALKVLTLNSQAERLAIFETLRRFSFSESDSARKILQQIFPLLANYLSDGVEGFTEEQAKYFRQYRWLKVVNRLTEKFNQQVTEIARNAGGNIYVVKSRNEIVDEEYSDGAAIFFIDGFGAEYMNFLATDLAPLGEGISIKYQVGRCNLPSVTQLNKDFLTGRIIAETILELDMWKHGNRDYPETILGELAILASLKEKILQALNRHEKIILCTDHGTSRLAVLARQQTDNADNAVPADNQTVYKTDNADNAVPAGNRTVYKTDNANNAVPAGNRTVYKSGRFADSLPDDAINFPTALEHDGKTIFADYSRFTQRGPPGSELHGGASLEEILVPVIVIERRN